jgi:branched-chain amino acid transport system ATP-binding protein/branched-chain amino acid transport system permease protein
VTWRAPAFGVGVMGYLLFTYWLAHGSLYLQGLILVAAVFAILALSLDLVAGMTGLYSLGHAGLFALGAYGTTLLYNDRGWNLFVLLPASMVGVGVVGLLLGMLSLRVSGLYFAITTFVFTLVITVLASDLSLTGGFNGLIGPIFPGFPGWLSWLGESVIWCCMLALLVAILIGLALRASPLYPVLLAIRDAEPFAQAAGARTALVKISLFGLSAAMAGAAGWVFTFQGIVSPSQFNWGVSVNILVMVILGGMNTTLGPVLGAAFVTMFPAQVSINPYWQEVLFGGLFVGVIILFPSGFVGFVTLLARRGSRLLGRSTEAPVVPVEPSAPQPAPVEIAAVEAAAREGAEHPEAVPVAAHGTGGTLPAVECHGIVFRYTKGAAVLNNVDFVVRKGTIHGLIGPNGSGKSTLVDLIAGRLKPQQGTIAIDGKRLEKAGPPARARQGLTRTFQAAVLVRELTTSENVSVGMYSRVPRIAVRAPVWPISPDARRDSQLIRAQAAKAMTFVGAEQWAKARVADVPHGVEQLTQLAAACVSGPSTLILDEPLAGLSPSEVEQAAAILAELKSADVSVILIEHQPRFVFAVCDEVTVLNAGEVLASGPAREVRANRRVQEVYLGR